MATKTTTALETPLREQLDRLARFEAGDELVLSLYVDHRPDQNGSRTHVSAFLRKAFSDRRSTIAASKREEFDRAVARIERYMAEDLPKSATGVVVFAATGESNFFEAVPLDATVEATGLFVGDAPHLYPIARLNDQFPRYAAVVLNSNSARLFVFGLASLERMRTVQNPKSRRSMVGGWSQARYQRRADNLHRDHIKEVVDALSRIVNEEHLRHIVVACDDVSKPILMELMPKHLAEMVIDVVHLDVKSTPEHEVLAATLEVLREDDARTDQAQVEKLLGASRAGGLGVVGADATLKALEMGQVEELLIAATPDLLEQPKGSIERDRPLEEQLVTMAQRNSARIRFVEDAALLKEVGGVGALLRFKI